MIRKCLIIAAGQGSRIEGTRHNVPKPLLPLCGMTLLERNILCAKKAGLKEFYIVVGYRGEEIKKAIDPTKLGVKITFLDNPDWEQPNGMSVLKASPYIREPFVLLMSDHIFHPEILAELLKQPRHSSETILAVDPRIDSIFDLDDGTKVLAQNGSIEKINKNLKDFNGIDTGIFVCSPNLFNTLEEVAREQPASLTLGMKRLAADGLLRAHLIGDRYWQDVDTPEAYRHAEKILLNSCRKETDGVISRNFNRFISLFISRWLVRLPISANVITVLTTFIGVSTYYFMSSGEYLAMLLGAFLFKLASVLDGVDGEMARLRMSQSKVGAWLDTISDNITYLAFLVGLFQGLWIRGYIPYYTFTVTMTVVGILFMLTAVIVYVHRFAESGSFVDIKGAVRSPWILQYLGPLIKRDLFSVIFLIATLCNMPEAILYLALAGTHTTWIILLMQKPDLFSRRRIIYQTSSGRWDRLPPRRGDVP